MPTLDRTFLADHDRFTAEGVIERTVPLEVGGDRLFAILDEPEDPGSARDLGFLVVHSFGLEVLTLRRTERGMARALAAAGHPVLTIHRRGFGDSQGDPASVSIAGQLQDLRAAHELLRSSTAARRVGAIGARFGGLLAGLLAREGDIDRLALIRPDTSGAGWTKSFMRELQVVRLADPDGSDARTSAELMQDLHRDGVLDVLGYPLPAAVVDQLADVDLTSDMGAFAGEALIAQVAKRPTLSKNLEALRDRLAAGGGRCRTELLREPAGSTFGSATFVATTADVNIRTDVMAPVAEDLAALTVGWAA